MILRFTKFALFVCLLFTLPATYAFGDTPDPEVLKLLFPRQIGAFSLAGLPTATDSTGSPQEHELMAVGNLDAFEARAEYLGKRNQKFSVEVYRFHQDAQAYSQLTLVLHSLRAGNIPSTLKNYEIGTASLESDSQVVFFKGPVFVRITGSLKGNNPGLHEFAQAFAETLDKGENEIPALIKHLPDYEESKKTALFLTRFKSLQSFKPDQSVLGAVNTDGNGDAAFVDTGSGKVLVVEYNTPQLAKDNDERIIAKIKELWKLGQQAPAAYRRVGNYSVFVFDSPDEATAKGLIDQVKYEQIVQWLGTNPYIYKEAEKQYVETTLGVFIAVVKASGYAFVGCAALGGLLGALLFARRKAQKGLKDAYSDAGGMLRLNIDELTPQTDPSRLLGPGR